MVALSGLRFRRASAGLWSAVLGAAVLGSCKRAPSTSSTDASAPVPPDGGAAISCNLSPSLLFEQRIAPILADDRPTSCNECHLSGINLGQFVRSTPCETMACMKEQELVDFEHPEQSLVLRWIERASPVSSLVSQEIIDEEYAAFRHWIEYSAECQETNCAGVICAEPSEEAFCAVQREPGPGTTPEMWDPGGCEQDVLTALFRDTFYAARGRCFPCHFDNQPNAPENAPRWVSTRSDCDTAARDTMRNIVEAGYVDVDDPEQSLILLKPLAEKEGGVEHEGHDKISRENDRAYANFTYWLQRYGECTGEPADAGNP